MTNGRYEAWLANVDSALASMNMSRENWQSRWPFDFMDAFERGVGPSDAAMSANRFWWFSQNKEIGDNCNKTVNCWLPKNHHGKCQLI